MHRDADAESFQGERAEALLREQEGPPDGPSRLVSAEKATPDSARALPECCGENKCTLLKYSNES